MQSILVDDMVKYLELEIIYLGENDDIQTETSDLNRPGLQFSGFFDYFAATRIQVVGKVEMMYLEGLDAVTRRERLRKYFEYPVPCVIISRGMIPPVEMLEEARYFKRPLLQSKLVTTKLINKAINFLDAVLAPLITRHGVLLDVYGVGIMIMGESGIGKSETALELVKRGHRLVADDVMEIKKVSDNRLVGEAPVMVRHLMEIRGIGIIDIKSMYGVGAVLSHKSIDIAIFMEFWESGKEYDRLGLEEEYTNILDVMIPKITVPVRPGRNLAIIIEVAAMNHRLKNMGYHAARDLSDRLTSHIRAGGNE